VLEKGLLRGRIAERGGESLAKHAPVTSFTHALRRRERSQHAMQLTRRQTDNGLLGIEPGLFKYLWL
jgi:hypothetical protein